MAIPGSTSKPAGAGAETAAEATLPAPRVERGAEGSAEGSASRAARAFLRHGRVERGDAGVAGIESVIGADSRVRILETDLAPWRMICALRLVGPTGSAIGTGWLAGPRTVVTAGHCVHHSSSFGGWVDRIEVSPGRDDGDFPFGTVTSTRFSARDEWVGTEDPAFDVGCIHLDEPIGEITGHFAFAALPDADLTDRLVNISGYPGDRGGGREQYFHANSVLHVGPNRIFYDVDTFGGQSGAPVWVQDADGAGAQGAPVVVGIHAYGTGGTPFDLGITANSAPRITSQLFDIISGWVARDGSGDAAA